MIKDCKGFSLIEAVVAISVLGLLGIFLTSSLISNLRSQARVRVSNQIKQNGQLVLDTLSRQIREADGVIFCDKAQYLNLSGVDKVKISDTIIVDKSGFLTRYKFEAPATPTNPTSNGYIAYDYPPNAERVGNQIGNDPCTNTIFGSVSRTYLTDPDNIKGISIETDSECIINSDICGIFIKSDKSGFQDALTIKFKVKPGIGSSLENLIEPVHFATTVQVRKL